MTSDDTRRRRALYRAQHRGTKEMDFMLGRYAEARLAGMAPADLTAFEELLALPDPELQGWLMHGRPFEASTLADLLRDIQAFHGIGAGPH
ncbi:MAG: succinate dehydrogenase assembly factor 2 [Hyphomicrobiaceae bacterium]